MTQDFMLLPCQRFCMYVCMYSFFSRSDFSFKVNIDFSASLSHVQFIHEFTLLKTHVQEFQRALLTCIPFMGPRLPLVFESADRGQLCGEKGWETVLELEDGLVVGESVSPRYLRMEIWREREAISSLGPTRNAGESRGF